MAKIRYMLLLMVCSISLHGMEEERPDRSQWERVKDCHAGNPLLKAVSDGQLEAVKDRLQKGDSVFLDLNT